MSKLGWGFWSKCLISCKILFIRAGEFEEDEDEDEDDEEDDDDDEDEEDAALETEFGELEFN